MSQDNEGQEKNVDDDGVNDPFVKPKDAQKVGRYTPLHWASYKGHYKVVWILIKAKLSAFDIDMHGNTSVHQAASDARGLKVLKCFMSRGCDLGMKNARGHTPLDLATTSETRELINRALSTVKCKGKHCGGSKFDFKNVRFYCESCTNFYCEKCCTRDEYFEDKDSTVKERPVCFCSTCLTLIKNAEKELDEAINTQAFEPLHKVLTSIVSAGTDINPHLLDKAEKQHLKLEKELDIRNFLDSVKHVTDYKTIKKSVQTLNAKRERAVELGVQLDEKLEEEINQNSSRLVAERNLRFEMDNCDVMSSTNDSIGALQDLIQVANDKSVEDMYMQ